MKIPMHITIIAVTPRTMFSGLFNIDSPKFVKLKINIGIQMQNPMVFIQQK